MNFDCASNMAPKIKWQYIQWAYSSLTAFIIFTLCEIKHEKFFWDKRGHIWCKLNFSVLISGSWFCLRTVEFPRIYGSIFFYSYFCLTRSRLLSTRKKWIKFRPNTTLVVRYQCEWQLHVNIDNFVHSANSIKN